MLLNFTIENWMSFRDRVTFSMVASRERMHGERISGLKKHNVRTLPITAIYGANASGKSNFFKALAFVKNLVLTGNLSCESNSVEPFLFDKDASLKPSRFVFVIMQNGTIYEFELSLTKESIVSEKLVKIGTVSDETLYHRTGENITYKKSFGRKKKFLKVVEAGIKNEQLFLTSLISQKINSFHDVYNWFSDTLKLVSWGERLALKKLFYDEDKLLLRLVNDRLALLDIGISHLDIEDEKIFACQTNVNGDAVKLELRQMSDGSLRAIDILTAIIDTLYKNTSSVYVFDELDSGLHTLLVRNLIESYLKNCNADTISQIIFTVHDVVLMNQDILRRDELWVAEREISGNTTLIPFSDYKDIRHDKDIRKSYLQGRMGGIPRVVSGGIFKFSEVAISSDDTAQS